MLLRKLYYFPSFFKSKSYTENGIAIPPKALIFTGRGDFLMMGKQYVEKFKRLGNLKPEHKVLDIGCGIGRIAIPLTEYLNSNGSYSGFDILEIGVKWCKTNIQSKFDNFDFKHIPLNNDLYNEKETKLAQNLVFPYKDSSFDFICLISVFTHMQIHDTFNYLQQISRVMKKDAICFATFFIIDDENLKKQNSCKNPFFKYHFENYSLHNLNIKDANVGYKFDYLLKMFENAGLEVKSVHKGWWTGKKNEINEDFQDIIIFRKKQANVIV